MSKLTVSQTKVVQAYRELLKAGGSFGKAMRAEAKKLGDTPCITFIEALAQVTAQKYKCNYTMTATGPVFHAGDKSSRETRNLAAFQCWTRNVRPWLKIAQPKPKRKAKAPDTKQRLSKELRDAAMRFCAEFEGASLAEQIKAARAFLLKL